MTGLPGFRNPVNHLPAILSLTHASSCSLKRTCGSGFSNHLRSCRCRVGQDGQRSRREIVVRGIRHSRHIGGWDIGGSGSHPNRPTSPNFQIDRSFLLPPSGSSCDPVKKGTHDPKTIKRLGLTARATLSNHLSQLPLLACGRLLTFLPPTVGPTALRRAYLFGVVVPIALRPAKGHR